MKYLGLILVVALVASQVLARRINEKDSPLKASNSTRGLSDGLRKYLENFKLTIRQGDEALGLPPLDPFKTDLYAIDLDEQYIKGHVELTDFEVLGLAGYKVDTADVSVIWRKITIGLTWPVLESVGSYKLNVTALNTIEVYGVGEYKITATDLSFKTVVSLGVLGGVSINSMETNVSLGGLALSMTGLLDDEDTSVILSEVISAVGPQLIQDYQHEITTTINKIVMRYGNEYLNGMSLSDLLALFG